MPETKSFLATVKDEIGDVFAGVYDELSEISSDDERLGAALKTTHKQVWEIVEKRLKESYRNGQKAGPARKDGNGKPPIPADTPPETRKNPFRK